MSLLELKEVSYQTILSDISLTIDSGAFITLSGPSGGGKSTLLKLIASLLTPTAGEIYFNGQKQREYPYTEFRQMVSYCFQQPTLFGDTVRDNLIFPYLIREEASDQSHLEKLLAQVDLPVTYLTELSGGERQRVALIRNLVFQPKMLLLDEVTVGLDEESKNIVHQLIATQQKAGVTILQVTHDDREIQQAKKLLIMKGGKLENESKR